MKLILNIYDKTGKNVERQVVGETYEIMFGTIQEIMSLLEITEDTDQWTLLKKVSGLYNELTNVLDGVFPGVSADEWKRVKLKELISLLLEIFKTTFTELLTIPSDQKNLQGA